jgi:PIN domain nuclease of toxin-antitoxin system
VPPAALDRPTSALRNPQAGFRAAPLDPDVAIYVRTIPRDFVPDMPDRIIAATALAMDLPPVSRDGRIRSANIRTIWQEGQAGYQPGYQSAAG